MIWTIVIWMAMQGQVDNSCAQTPPSLCFFNGCEKMAVEIDGGCPVLPTTPGIDPNMTTPPKNYMMPPNLMESVTQPVSAEHVFEIRTKREDHGNAIDERKGFMEGGYRCADSEDILETPNQCHGQVCTSMYIAPHCVRITRELYMDGKRLGSIKGLD